jgi:hypothetical protein
MSHLRLFRHGSSFLATTVILGLGANIAQAVPVVPGATPLSMTELRDPVGCPSLADLDGTNTVAQMSRKNGSLYNTRLPHTAIAVCDPDLVRAHRFLGPITGTAKASLSYDITYFGLRALGAPERESGYVALHPGDQLQLPIVGPAANIDVTVATPGGARTVRVAAAGARPTAVRVVGPDATPTLFVDRDSAASTQVAVPPVIPVPFVLKPRYHGRTLEFGGRASPGSAITTYPLDTSFAFDDAVVGADGKLRSLTLKLNTRSRWVTVIRQNVRDRTTDVQGCRVRWQHGRDVIKSVRCSARTASLTAEASGVNDVTVTAAPKPTPVTAATPKASLSGRLAANAAAAGKPRPPKLATVPATTTTLKRTSDLLQWFDLAGDVNGDGLPDASLYEWDFNPRHDQDSLLVSQPGGWRQVPVNQAADGQWELLPDLNGDGRAELRLGYDSGVATDLLAGPTPSVLNLPKSRPAAPSDLYALYDDSTVAHQDQSWAVTPEGPIDAVDDVTGDGRPEVVLGGPAAIITASQDLTGATHRKLALIAPLRVDALQTRSGSTGDYAAPESADERPSITAARDARQVTSVTNGHTLVVARAAAEGHRPLVARPITISEQDALGRVLRSTSFTDLGVPKLVDYDGQTGEALLIMRYPGECPHKQSCSDRIIRVSASGVTLSTISFPRIEFFNAKAAFTPDGPDADDQLDEAVWFDRGSVSGPTAAPRWPGDRGTVAILTSTTTGTVPLTALPVLGKNGVPLQSMIDLSHAVLPNGTRWLGGGFQTSLKNSADQDSALVAQAR